MEKTEKRKIKNLKKLLTESFDDVIIISSKENKNKTKEKR
jgi:hypothetical protein